MRHVITWIFALWAGVASAQTCEGRYGDADALLELAYSRYGTLYSGGTNYQSVGPTLEVYRLLMGLPDSGMAAPRDSAAAFVDPAPESGVYDTAFVAETLERSLPRIHDPEFRRDGPDGSTDSEVLLNRLSTVGPFPGWWLAPTAPHLSQVEQVIASYSEDDALDWLLTVQAASARPHTLSWTLQSSFRIGRSPASRAVFVHALDRYAETNSLPWFVAVLLSREHQNWEYDLTPVQRGALETVDALLEALNARVADCTADAAEYVAQSIGLYEDIRVTMERFRAEVDLELAAELPPILRRMTAVQLAKVMVNRRWYRDPPFDAQDLVRLANDPQFDRWLNAGRSYRAATIEDLIEINAGVELDPKTVRLLNILSVEDLLAFAESRADFPVEYRDITTGAFLRLFALRRDDEAAAMVDTIVTLWPDLAEDLTDAWSYSGSEGYRLARVALALPEPRTLIVPAWTDWGDRGAFTDNLQNDFALERWTTARRSRDLPLTMRTGGFLVRDFETWMSASGSTQSAGWQLQRRNARRGMPFPDILTGVQPLLPESSGRNAFTNLGPAGFAGWEELSQLGPDTGLANRIGQELVLNARAQTSGVFGGLFANTEPLAAEVAFVIAQGRRMFHGEMEGRPLGQVAFEVLHGSLGRTEAAERTPYWYVCRERCEP